MRTMHSAMDAVEAYSPAEEAFNRRRRTIGLFVGPAVFLFVWLAPITAPPAAHRLAAILGLVGVFWVTEALPMAVTGMLGPVLAVVLGVTPATDALRAFGDPLVFLFIGAFMMAEAMFVHGVDRRLAFSVLARRGRPANAVRLLMAYGAVTGAMSMWVSNTAATAMMVPIGLAIVAQLGRVVPGGPRAVQPLATALMIVTAFGATIGGLATMVGTPPNLIGVGMLDHITGYHVGFVKWMALGLPLAVALFIVLVIQLGVGPVARVRLEEGEGSFVAHELEKLGPWSAGPRNVVIAFGVAVALWIAPALLYGLGQGELADRYLRLVPEGVAAMIGAILLFVLPVDWRRRRFTLSWEEAVRIDWGIILLYGGGLALGELAFGSGLGRATGRALASYLPVQTPLTLTVLFTALAIIVSEGTSNIASAIMVVPVAIAVAQATGVRPIEPALGATLGSSMGFMLPLSTAPNAIIYSSGHVPISALVRHGLVLDIIAFFLIVATVLLVCPLVF